MHPKRPGHYLRYYRQREPLRFQGAQPLRPLLPLLNGDIWCNLLEILCRDLYGMLDTNVHHKIAISRLSLVCRDWACRFRPILFQRVVLYSRNDLHTVVDFVKSPHSRLLDHITFLDFHPMFGLLDIPWLHLIPLELRVKVRQLCLVNPLQSSPTPSLTSVFVLLPKAPPTSFAPFTHLCLYKHVFRSFLALRRLLSSLPNLQELGLRDVNWREGWYLPKAEPYLRRPVGLKCFRTSDLHQAWGLLSLSPLGPMVESYVALSDTTAYVLTATDYEYLEELLRSAVNCIFIAGGCNAGSASVSTEPDRNATGYLFNNICIRSESSLDCIKCSLSRPVASTLARPDNIHLQLHLRADFRGSGHHYRTLIRHTLPSLAPILLSCCQQLKISLVGHLLFRTSFTRVENDIRRCFDICLQRPVGAEERLEYLAPSLDVNLTGLVIQLIVPSSTRYFFYDNVDSDSPVREEETSYEDGPHFIQFDQADHRAVYLHEVLRGGATLVRNEEPTKDEMLTAAWTGSPRFQIEVTRLDF
ncbi:hypothetical protein BC629DRAFT_1176128 [Irpex lacteus]|nr:hypothetical protein BC629DRAFT_1176128 [Irpex lacteus]